MKQRALCIVMSFLLTVGCFAGVALADDSESISTPQEVLEAYLDAQMEQDASEMAALSFDEKQPDSAKVQQSLSEAFSLNGPRVTSYTIESETVEDDSTICYSVLLYHNNGEAYRGNLYVRNIGGTWKVYRLSDVRKELFRPVPITPEQEARLAEVEAESRRISEESRKNSGSLVSSLLRAPQYSQTQFANWYFVPLSAYSGWAIHSPWLSGYYDSIRINVRQWTGGSALGVTYEIWDHVNGNIYIRDSTTLYTNDPNNSYQFGIPLNAHLFTQAELNIYNNNGSAVNTYGEAYAIVN